MNVRIFFVKPSIVTLLSPSHYLTSHNPPQQTLLGLEHSLSPAVDDEGNSPGGGCVYEVGVGWTGPLPRGCNCESAMTRLVGAGRTEGEWEFSWRGALPQSGGRCACKTTRGGALANDRVDDSSWFLSTALAFVSALRRLSFCPCEAFLLQVSFPSTLSHFFFLLIFVPTHSLWVFFSPSLLHS